MQVGGTPFSTLTHHTLTLLLRTIMCPAPNRRPCPRSTCLSFPLPALFTHVPAAPCRTQDPATALALFEKLWTGEDSAYCMRARIDMKSLNGCLRDPVMFRFNADPHHITGTKYAAAARRGLIRVVVCVY